MQVNARRLLEQPRAGQPSTEADITEGTWHLEDLPERIRSKITVHPVSGCWIGGRTTNNYWRIRWDGRTQGAHRVVYMLLVGPIPPKHDLDHVKANGCIHKACCWPAHLEPVTRKENLRRGINHQASKTECLEGHKLVPENLVSSMLPARICLICQRRRNREYMRQRRARSRAEREALSADRAALVARLRPGGLTLREIRGTVARDLDNPSARPRRIPGGPM